MAACGHTAVFPVNQRRIRIRNVVIPFSTAHLFNSCHNAANRHGSQDFIHLRDFRLYFFFITLCKTAGYNQRLQLPAFFQFRHLQDGINAFFLGVSDKTAGIYHCRLGFRFIIRKGMPAFSQHSQHHLGVHKILIAAQGNK